MPILLTTPFDPGDNDPGQTYPRAKIIEFTWREGLIEFMVQFGDVSGDDWVQGQGGKPKGFVLTDSDYDAVVAEISLTDELVYAGVKRVLYQWLIDNGHAAGTIE